MGENKTMKDEYILNDGYRDVEKRRTYQREYQREYQRARYWQKKAIRHGVDEEMAKDLVKDENTFQQALDGLKEELPREEKDTIDKVEKWVKLGSMLIQGFVDAAKQGGMFQPQQQQQQQGPTPPPGWIEATPLQRMSKKFDGAGNVTDWYRQGLAWESGTGVQAVSQMPVQMNPTYHGAQTASRAPHNPHMGGAQPANTSMAALNQRAANENWDTPSGGDMANAPQVERTDGAPKNINEALAQKKAQQGDKVKEQEQQPDAEQVLSQVGAELQKDQEMYLGVIVEYFKTRTLKEFEKDLNTLDDKFQSYMSFIKILPFQAKELLKRTTLADFETVLQKEDPQKIDLIEKKGLRPKLEEFWNKLLQELE